MMQSVIPAVYPILKQSYHLDFGQIGLITLTSQLTASLLQPLVGLYTDHRPTPYSLPIGMTFTMVGLIVIASAPTFGIVLAAVAMVGMGSAVFHPESSRVARMASGGQHGLAQSLVSGGRQRRIVDGTAAGGVYRASGRAAQHRVVFGRGAAGHRGADAGGRMVQGASQHDAEIACDARDANAVAAPHDCGSDGDSDRAGLFQVLLHGEPDQLLHVLPDRQISRLGADGAGASLRVSGRGGGGNHHRRAGGRSHRAQVCDLVARSWECCRSRWRCRTRTCSGRRF